MPVPYVWLLCGYSQTYQLIPIAIQLQKKSLLMMDSKSPKHVESLMINKDSLLESVHLVGLLIYTLYTGITLFTLFTSFM